MDEAIYTTIPVLPRTGESGTYVTPEIQVRQSLVQLLCRIHGWQKYVVLFTSFSPRCLGWDFEYPVDLLRSTSEEFKIRKKQVGIVKEAVEKGIEI